MAEERIPVGVIVEKLQSQSAWVDHLWVARTVVPGLPDTSPMTPVDSRPGAQSFYLGGAFLVLATSDTMHDRDNLLTGDPKLWVVLREDPFDGTLELLAVTADPSEGEGYTQAGSDIVDAVPMHPDIAAYIAGFVDTHHVEREFFKRRRDRSNPALAGRPAHQETDE